MGGLNVTAIIIFVGFVGASLMITWWAANRTKSAGEFYTAGGTITGMQNGLALAGDFMSAATFLGLTGLVFIGGVDAMLFTTGIAVGWALILFVFADRLRNLGRFTFADVVAYRLQSGPLRVLAAVGTLTVAIPYLIAQMVGAGSLIETLFGLPYWAAVVIVGTLMTTYVVFGGMLATTWVQVIKAVLLLGGGTMLLVLTLAAFGFNLDAMFAAAADAHPRGESIFGPGLMYTDPISVISLGLAFLLGTAGLPHVLMRFFTVPDAQQARRSIGYAVVFIGYFQAAVVLIGFGAVALLSGQTEYVDESGTIAGGANMVSVYLSRHVGGEAFLGFMSAVAFATILAVVAGILLSASAGVAHDIYARVIRKGNIDDREEVRVSRIATVVIGATAIFLSLAVKDVNVGILSTFPLAIAASVNFPAIFLALFWKDLTTRGAIAGGVVGLIVVVVLSILSPTIWVQVLGHETAPYPYAYPTLFSASAAFIVTIFVSKLDRSERAAIDRSGYAEQLVRSELGRKPEKFLRK
ncbi:MAG: sodium/solute symporter [Gammaproteobacteria bacterium]|nr:sodium/solute symporter [Gammaproteobacteria bacterium]